MTKLKAIKSIEDFKEYNIICTTTEEVRECLEMLEKSNFKVDKQINEDDIVVFYNENVELFACTYCIISERKNINFYTFKKIYNRLKKQQEQQVKLPDFETDENGRIIKINNFDSHKNIYILNFAYIKEDIICCVNNYNKEYLDMYINTGLIFSSKEALDNYLKYITIHTKIKNIASRLNNGKDIDWKNDNQEKYYLGFDNCIRLIQSSTWVLKYNLIYCLDENFLNETIKEIGRADLMWYLKQSY